MHATFSGSCPGVPGLMPPGASPYSPFVHVTTTVLRPSSAYRARIPPVLDDSSSGCACTAISVGTWDIDFTLFVRRVRGLYSTWLSGGAHTNFGRAVVACTMRTSQNTTRGLLNRESSFEIPSDLDPSAKADASCAGLVTSRAWRKRQLQIRLGPRTTAHGDAAGDRA